MENLFEEALILAEEKLSKIHLEMKEMKNFMLNWSETKKLTESWYNSGISKALGIYFIIHNLTGQIMYIGNGVITVRRDKHKRTFENGGKYYKSKSNKNSSWSDGSTCGGHMYNYDPNLENWSFKWVHLGSKFFSEVLESVYIKKYNPPFNNESMAGK